MTAFLKTTLITILKINMYSLQKTIEIKSRNKFKNHNVLYFE